MSIEVVFFDQNDEPVGDPVTTSLDGGGPKWTTGSVEFAAPRFAIKASLRISSTTAGSGSVCVTALDLRAESPGLAPGSWPNGGAEIGSDGSGPDNWAKVGAEEHLEQLEWSDSLAATGSRSLCVHRTDSDPRAATAYWMSDLVPAEGGSSYTLSFQQYFDDIPHLPPPNWSYQMKVSAEFLDADGKRARHETLMMVAGSSGTTSSSRPAAMTMPPECCPRWRGKS
jgi:hypothetical protein